MENMVCKNCGAELEQKSEKVMRCPCCKTEYLLRKDKNQNVQIKVSYQKLERMIIGGLIIASIVIFGGRYLWKNYIRTPEKERFSKAYQVFLTEAYDKDVHEITDEELAKMTYLRIDSNEVRYVFSYSFEKLDDPNMEPDELMNVESISVDYATNPIMIEDAGNLTGLEWLEIVNGADIKDISFLTNMKHLGSLKIDGINQKIEDKLESQYGDILIHENE